MDDRNWMYLENHACDDFLNGVLAFITVAEKDMKEKEKNIMLCPCMGCWNDKRFPHSMHLHAHLIMRGFKKNYKIWNKYGEEGLNPGETEQGLQDGSGYQGPSSSSKGGQHLAYDDILPIDDDFDSLVENVGQMMQDAEGNNEFDYSEGECAKFQELVRDSKKPLYPGCHRTFTLLNLVLKLLKLKASHCWSDRSFTTLLALLRDMLLEGNELPSNTYEAKKIICPLGLEVEKIHACKEDCILYHGDYAELTECPFCGTSRYKHRKDGGDEDIPSNRNDLLVKWCGIFLSSLV